MSAGRRAVSALGALAVVLGGLTGCSADDPREGCHWMDDQSVADGADATVILVDGTTSTRGGGSGAGDVDYGPLIGDLLDEDGKSNQVISIGTFGGSGGEVEWTVQRRSADWRRSNDNASNQEDNREDANRCLEDDITAARRVVPAGEGTDVLAGLAAGAEMFDGVRGERRLLVLTDGLSTTGCADLTSARFGSAQDLKSIVSVCGTQGEFGELPDLRGVRVTFMGLGHSAGGQPSADSARRAWLGKLWKALCERAGAGQGSCVVGKAPVSRAGESGEHTGGALPDDPVVSFGEGGARTYTLSGAALFATDSARLRDKAEPALVELAVTARTTPSLDRVEVHGYVDPRGTRANDRELSQARADTVADKLVEHGVPAARVKAYGEGVSPGCPADAAEKSGTREQRLQCDRRVDVKIIGK
ncbi:OmpA family protein [Streptomyces sp. NPDC013433]|uniref:OmpA family protein n=1 Tax=Streptomyces sp. NPDC013433 TaxID=3155604 RepID=UPI003452FC96